MTISYLSIPNSQLAAKRSRNTFAINDSSIIVTDSRKDSLTHSRTDSLTTSRVHDDQFVSKLMDANGSCFIWSANVLAFDAWLPANCSTNVTYPFIVCEKNLKTNLTSLVNTSRFFTLLYSQCTLEYIDLDGNCIRTTRNVNYRRSSHLKWNAKAILDNAVLMRILTAWTIPSFTGQERHAINVVTWRENNNCECLTSVDTLYMEIKTWYYKKNCSCSMKYPTLLKVPQTNTLIPNNIFSCDDGSFKQVAYRCDGENDCSGMEDEQNCFHICSTHTNCNLDCVLPECTCAQLYHQCTLGGCVHQTFLCDGVVHCPADDSDELMCQYQLSINVQRKRILTDAFSLCNSFSNETYPNNEICLLTRDQFGVTEHCSNTEHLRFCVDFSCPNHYKCSDSYCIPRHLVCDGVKDCPTGQDEEQCGELSCEGYFQCKGSRLCLHLNYLCDGVVDCAVHRDDEQFCDGFQCPKECECIGFTVNCITVAPSILQSLSRYTDRKVIILRSKNVIVNSANILFKYFHWLLILNLTNTRFAGNLYPYAFSHMQRLRILDLTNTGIILQKRSKFRYMDSVKHIILIRSKTFILYLNTFQLPNLLSLLLQHSQIQHIQPGAICSLSNLRTLDLSSNKIKHISSTTFQCLNGLHSLDISDNKLAIIEEASLDGIIVVSFSGQSTLCCYLNPNSSCQVNQKTLTRVDIQSDCQSILSQHIVIKVLYIFMGGASTLISIVFIIKRTSREKVKLKESSKYIKAVAASDILNGMYLLLVFICDLINKLLTYKITRRQHFMVLLQFLSAFPNLSMITTRVEHLLLTVGMYIAICHVFSDYNAHMRVARFMAWAVSVTYCVIDTVILRYTVFTSSAIWQPYHQTDHSTMDIVSIASIIGYELATSLVNIFLCTRIYKTVQQNEARITAKRIPRQHLVARRLMKLTIGRFVITLSSVSLSVLLRSHLGLSIVAKQVSIALVVPSSTIINLVMFYYY